MKSELEIFTNEDGNKVVLLSKSLKGLSTYEEIKEIESFKKDLKRFESGVDFVIRDILNQHGIIPNETQIDDLKPSESTKFAYNKALTELQNKTGFTIDIKDCYENTTEKVLWRKDLITIVQDYDHTISCANEVVVWN